MFLHRRSLLTASILPFVAFQSPAFAQQATPAPFIEPELILAGLLETPVTSPLLPVDLGVPEARPWIDEGDTDLIDTVGGVLIHAGSGDDAPLLGLYLVHPTPNDAEARLNPDLLVDTPQPFPLLDLPGLFDRTVIPGIPGSLSRIVVAEGPVIVSALGQGEDESANDLRALANLAGLLDHLRLVTGSLE